jgi:hypothetical protein
MNGFSLYEKCQENTKQEGICEAHGQKRIVRKPYRSRREVNEIGVNEAGLHYYVLPREELSATPATCPLVQQGTFNVQKDSAHRKIGFQTQTLEGKWVRRAERLTLVRS